MRKTLLGLALLLALGAGGCGDDDRRAIDLGTMGLPDADSPADMNVPPPVDLGGGPAPDLGGSGTDAGGTRDIAAICTAACDALSACSMEPAGPECAMGCAPDLADCSPAEFAAISACTTAGCASEGDPPMPKIVGCLQAVSCIDMGGGMTPPHSASRPDVAPRVAQPTRSRSRGPGASARRRP